MKILWIVSTASNYEARKRHVYNGCGWIESLECAMKKKQDVTIGVAFFTRNKEPFSSVLDLSLIHI